MEPGKLLGRLVGLVFALAVAAAAAAAVYIYSLYPELPSAAEISHISLKEPLRIYTRDGLLIGEYGNERRSPVAIDSVPQSLINAILAAEDDAFYSHPGIDVSGIARAMLANLRSGEHAQGASTITMQVARNFFLTPEKTYRRKLKEILLAFRLENTLTKDEILELYINKIFLGHRAYGFAAAAGVYYGRSLDELTLPQMAMLAGLPKAPSRNNPISNPFSAGQRRDYVLGRMLELGHIDRAAYAEAVSTPITAQRQAVQVDLDASYVAEMLRQEVHATFGDAVYESGYRVYATVEGHLQRAANRALRAGLLAYDRRHGYRGPVEHHEISADTPVDRLDRILAQVPTSNEIVPAIVIGVGEREFKSYRDGSVHTIQWEAMDWARQFISARRLGPELRGAADVVRPGDVVYVAPDPQLGWQLAQIPAVSGALVSLDPETGAILALSGGFDYFLSAFNRASQAMRQPGSNIKPFIYSAALEYGFTAATPVSAAPVVVEDVAEGYWRPENYSGKFLGPTPLRKALSLSLNLVSVRLLRAMGIDYARDHIMRFGFEPEQIPAGMSLALGAASMSPLQVARAYAVFANGGYLVEPYLLERIVDPAGTTIHRAQPAAACDALCEADATPSPVAQRAISAANAFVMAGMLQQVIRSGTAVKAQVLEQEDIAGKTGTTNDFRDAWFSGFTRDLVATSWVGFDQPRDLGKSESGAKAALPIWVDFMATALAHYPPRPFEAPDGVSKTFVNRETGLPTSPGDPDGYYESFIAGTEPTSPSAVSANSATATESVRDDLF